MDYSGFITELGELMVIPVTDPTSATPFNDAHANAILPGIITYAEQRMYRDIDLVETITSATQAFTPSTRSVLIPGSLIVLNQINVITPAGSAPDTIGAQRNPLRRVSRDFLDMVCPVGTTSQSSGIPEYYANVNNTTVVVGPAPTAAYTAEFVGTVRPAPLSSTNTTTILTTYLPDVFVIAAMIFASAYQKNFYAAGSDNPKSSQTYEMQYMTLIKSAFVEEQRKKSWSAGWQPYSPTPAATPPRQ